MADKPTKIEKYLTTTGWATFEMLCSKFALSPTELSTQLGELLSTMDVRIDRNIIHVTKA